MEEEVAKLPDKDGWIRINEFMKFAMPLDLCKIEFHDRVFQKHDYDAEEKKAKQEAKEAAKSKKVNCPASSFPHQNFLSLQDPDLAYNKKMGLSKCYSARECRFSKSGDYRFIYHVLGTF